MLHLVLSTVIIVYVLDKGNNCVQVLNSDLTFSAMFGETGSGRGQLAYPQGIACDNTGCVYVADSDNHRVHVFSGEGDFLNAFGVKGQARDEMNLPSGVAVDEDGVVYVSQAGSDRFSAFAATENDQFELCDSGIHPESLLGPCGVAVVNGVVYVCDVWNGCVRELPTLLT